MAKRIIIEKSRPDSERRLRQASRLARQLRILERIQGKARWTAANLAGDLEVDERTIFRDLNALELAGVSYQFDERERCYRLLTQVRFPVVNLTPDELLDQATASVVASAKGVAAAGGARATTLKLEAKSSEQNAQLLADAQQLMAVLDLKLPDHDRHGEILRTLQWALLQRKQVIGQYTSPYQQKPVRLTLHPYRICFSRQAWYLIARSTEVANPRTYRIARFQTVRPLDRSAEVPIEFDLKAYFGNAWSVYRGSETFDVELHFEPEAARIVTETTWHHTQKANRHGDGSATLKFQVDGLDEILWWLLGWAGFVRIDKPDKLRTMFVEQLQKGLAQNEPAIETAAKKPRSVKTTKSTRPTK
jgi:predicted DNA-binding transcriptional regulator YafY